MNPLFIVCGILLGKDYLEKNYVKKPKKKIKEKPLTKKQKKYQDFEDKLLFCFFIITISIISILFIGLLLQG